MRLSRLVKVSQESLRWIVKKRKRAAESKNFEALTLMDSITRLSYPSDLTDDQWDIVEPLIPRFTCGRQPKVNFRELLNAIFYVLKAGCQWRMVPHDFGIRWTVVYDWFRRWRDNGTWERIHDGLLSVARVALGKEHEKPSAGIIDSQTIKGAETTENSAFDKGKLTKGRKRHLVVDTLGLIWAVVITSAGVQDSEAAEKCFQEPNIRNNERLKIVFADQGYHRYKLYDYLKNTGAKFELEIVRKKEDQVGFQVLPKRWIVERTNSWIRGARRLAKDYERKESSSRSLIHIRAINLMTKRISDSQRSSQTS